MMSSLKPFLILYYIKQIDSKLLCVCSVIDHRGRQNVVRTSVPLFCSYHILTFSVIYYWTDAQQLGIYLLNRVKLCVACSKLTTDYQPHINIMYNSIPNLSPSKKWPSIWAAVLTTNENISCQDGVWNTWLAFLLRIWLPNLNLS